MTKDARKDFLLKWFKEYFGEGKREVLTDYVHPDYIQHIAFLPDGPEGINIFLDMHGGTFSVDIKHIIADEEMMMVRFKGPGPSVPDHPWYGMEMAVADFFTFKDDKFYEHWYAVEPIIPTASGYDMFEDVLESKSDVSAEEEISNRELIRTVFTNAFNGDVEAFDRVMSDSPYIEHSPHVPDGTRNLFKAYQKYYNSPVLPKGKVIFSFAEGDLVVTFNSYVFPNSPEIVVGHMTRVWDGKIVEHWDIHTPVPPPEEFQHPNGMY